jgi:hypothetical protein
MQVQTAASCWRLWLQKKLQAQKEPKKDNSKGEQRLRVLPAALLVRILDFCQEILPVELQRFFYGNWLCRLCGTGSYPPAQPG